MAAGPLHRPPLQEPYRTNAHGKPLKTKTAGHASGRFANDELNPSALRRLAQPPCDDVGGRLAQIPDQAERGEPEHVVGDVDLPPEEALARRRPVVVVVVVPALAEGEEREDEVVAAVVLGLVAARPNMWVRLLIVKVTCQLITVLTTKPQTRTGKPPIR